MKSHKRVNLKKKNCIAKSSPKALRTHMPMPMDRGGGGMKYHSDQPQPPKHRVTKTPNRLKELLTQWVCCFDWMSDWILSRTNKIGEFTISVNQIPVLEGPDDLIPTPLLRFFFGIWEVIVPPELKKRHLYRNGCLT